jgi:hypothetical protein
MKDRPVDVTNLSPRRHLRHQQQASRGPRTP